MIYLKKFELLSDYDEHNILRAEERKIFNNVYPLHIFPMIELDRLDFEPITIIYGGNGSGKSTLLNIIATKIEAIRKSPLDKGTYFNMYVARCNFEMSTEPLEIKVITSDDVFDYLLDVRSINANVNRRKEKLAALYLQNKYDSSDDNITEYEKIKNTTESRSMTMSKYIRSRLANNNIIEQSNGESALLFWEREIKEDAIYILDEPENSLSAENQIKLKKFIEESARFYNCQFIISTHSPFLLALEEAKIYNLDNTPVKPEKWTALPNVRLYRDFFKEREREFED